MSDARRTPRHRDLWRHGGGETRASLRDGVTELVFDLEGNRLRAYCASGGRSTPLRMASSAGVAELLNPIGLTPNREAQARQYRGGTSPREVSRVLLDGYLGGQIAGAQRSGS